MNAEGMMMVVERAKKEISRCKILVRLYTLLQSSSTHSFEYPPCTHTPNRYRLCTRNLIFSSSSLIAIWWCFVTFILSLAIVLSGLCPNPQRNSAFFDSLVSISIMADDTNEQQGSASWEDYFDNIRSKIFVALTNCKSLFRWNVVANELDACFHCCQVQAEFLASSTISTWWRRHNADVNGNWPSSLLRKAATKIVEEEGFVALRWTRKTATYPT